jgi:hypothetical protein
MFEGETKSVCFKNVRQKKKFKSEIFAKKKPKLDDTKEKTKGRKKVGLAAKRLVVRRSTRRRRRRKKN